MKCSPIKFSGFSVPEASRVTEIEDVLVASIALHFTNGFKSEKIFFLTCSFSVAASIIRSQELNSEKSFTEIIKSMATSLLPLLILFFFSNFFKSSKICDLDLFIVSRSTSVTNTLKPDKAQTYVCAETKVLTQQIRKNHEIISVDLPRWAAPCYAVLFQSNVWHLVIK